MQNSARLKESFKVINKNYCLLELYLLELYLRPLCKHVGGKCADKNRCLINVE